MVSIVGLMLSSLSHPVSYFQYYTTENFHFLSRSLIHSFYLQGFSIRENSANGPKILLHNGDQYTKHSTNRYNTYWRCRFYYKQCRARVSTRYMNGRTTLRSTMNAIHSDTCPQSRNTM